MPTISVAVTESWECYVASLPWLPTWLWHLTSFLWFHVFSLQDTARLSLLPLGVLAHTHPRPLLSSTLVGEEHIHRSVVPILPVYARSHYLLSCFLLCAPRFLKHWLITTITDLLSLLNSISFWVEVCLPALKNLVCDLSYGFGSL
jgi:hypothetical protein